MSRTAFQAEPLVPTSLTPVRARRWCLLVSLRALRLSVWRGRAMSLPNLLRLYRRRYAEMTEDVEGSADADEGLAWLTALYRTEQPFDDSDRRWSPGLAVHSMACRRRPNAS